MKLHSGDFVFGYGQKCVLKLCEAAGLPDGLVIDDLQRKALQVGRCLQFFQHQILHTLPTLASAGACADRHQPVMLLVASQD